VGTGTAQIQIGQVNVTPQNPPEFDNPGWDPYGASDTTHYWWNIESGAVMFNGLSNALTIVWGSPNDNDPSATNTVTFYSGANGSGSVIGKCSPRTSIRTSATSTIRRIPAISYLL
jgi:hypothetical protein